MKILFKNETKYNKEIYENFLNFHNKKFHFKYTLYTAAIIMLLIFCLSLQVKYHNYTLAILFEIFLSAFFENATFFSFKGSSNQIIGLFYHTLKKIAIKATPHKINKHALCNTAQSISKRTYLCEAPFCVHKAEFFDYYLELEE